MDTETVLRETELRSKVCFLCKWIHQDLKLNKKLTGWPLDWGGSAIFPVEGKLKHLALEGLTAHSASL